MPISGAGWEQASSSTSRATAPLHPGWPHNPIERRHRAAPCHPSSLSPDSVLCPMMILHFGVSHRKRDNKHITTQMGENDSSDQSPGEGQVGQGEHLMGKVRQSLLQKVRFDQKSEG